MGENAKRKAGVAADAPIIKRFKESVTDHG